MTHLLAAAGNSSVTLNLGNSLNKPSDSVVIIIALTLVAVAPAMLIMLTGFTRIIIVLSFTRNALGLQTVPPNQVLIGLAMFLSLFIMTPTLSQMNKVGLQPYLHGQATVTQAYDAAQVPLKEWMLKQTRTDELSMFENEVKQHPSNPQDLSLGTIVPAFILSEIKSAFIMGFVIFVPFLVIDLIVSSTLMSMGMMMLPPTLVSLPFKVLLFVMVDGWTLVAHSLLTSFR